MPSTAGDSRPLLVPASPSQPLPTPNAASECIHTLCTPSPFRSSLQTSTSPFNGDANKGCPLCGRRARRPPTSSPLAWRHSRRRRLWQDLQGPAPKNLSSGPPPQCQVKGPVDLCLWTCTVAWIAATLPSSDRIQSAERLSSHRSSWELIAPSSLSWASLAFSLLSAFLNLDSSARWKVPQTSYMQALHCLGKGRLPGGTHNQHHPKL